jgi:hypothetical protein
MQQTHAILYNTHSHTLSHWIVHLSLGKRCIFRAVLKVETDFFSLTLLGRLFHTVEDTNLKALWLKRLVLMYLALRALFLKGWSVVKEEKGTARYCRPVD